MTIDTLTFTTSAFTGTASTFTLDLTVSPIAGTTDDNVTNITMSGSTTPIEVSYNNSSNQLSTLSTSPESIDISFVVNGVDYEFFNKGTGYLMVSGPKGNLTAQTVSNVTFVCYVEGTRILTTRGEIAVEDLRVGDLAVTASGARRPIRWTGHRRIDPRLHPRPEQANPIRIDAHAFGPNKPHRDLFVSPGHSLCVDVVGEVLIRAHSLLNGTTIQQMDVDSVVYWHVELDSHDILLAENLPAESYFDMDNRSFFVESGVVLIDMTPDAEETQEAEFCRPLHVEGPVVAAVRAQLLAQAKTLGWMLETAPFNDLHLMADGVRIDPETEGLQARFAIPGGAVDVWLVSKTTQPRNLPGDSFDLRPLGVCLKSIALDDATGRRALAIEDARLVEGFHQLESYNWGALRWLSGRARIPGAVLAEASDGFALTVELTRPPLPIWVAPAAQAALRAA